MSHVDETFSLPKKFLLEINELRDDISHSRKTLKLIEKSLNESISKIAIPTENGDQKK